MAINPTVIHDGVYTKIIDLTCTAVAADTQRVFQFGVAPLAAMTAFNAHNGAPIDVHVVDTDAAAATAGKWGVSAFPATGFTVDRIAGAGTSSTARVVLRVIHPLDQ
jgi:hypothetical protein